jgi:hypothetical protein
MERSMMRQLFLELEQLEQLALGLRQQLALE